MDLLLDEPGTRRIFVNTMQGMLYSVSFDGKTVKPSDLNDPKWETRSSPWAPSEVFRALRSTRNLLRRALPASASSTRGPTRPTLTPMADFVPLGAGHTHDEILLEWTAKDPKGAA
jgi:hypothetical protein